MLQRDAEITKHKKELVVKQSKRAENELYSELAELRLLQQARDAEYAEKEVRCVLLVFLVLLVDR